MNIVEQEVFRNLMERRAGRLLAMAKTLQRAASNDQPVVSTLTRPFVGAMLSQSAQVEELLDAYGARRNREWRPFRGLVATAKLFSDVHYMLLHIRHALPSYRLQKIETELSEATAVTLNFTGNAILRASVQLLAEAGELGLTSQALHAGFAGQWAEPLPTGALEANRVVRKARSAREIVVHLATAYLALAAQSEVLHKTLGTDPDQYAQCIPDPVNETELRHMQQRFHSLQALYDTHVDFTDLEARDPDMTTLRGQITVVFHLLETATHLCHYYERHVTRVTTLDYAEAPREQENLAPSVESPALLATLMGYSLKYAGRVMTEGRALCQAMLRQYSECGTVTVTAPRYRGFHVRPSTLIAKIVHHYGTTVTMYMDGASYDAGAPMDLFRANEKINARKRRWFTDEVSHLLNSQDHERADSVEAEVRRIIMTLAEQGKVVIYQQPLPIEVGDGVGSQRNIIEEVASLQGLGKIDIQVDIDVDFEGDTRVLRDITVLADHGYGEDNFGNNISLPAELSYLKR